ncbi:PREDICTED: uncharacterized protein LOC108759426 [Trachymyrmex cornetzi]|uniref:uncharacterized protein LOC108759426 n=1 Tax=Trachymyrmex cornetzi TaxID=471704 RepID=UPI00084EEA2F|nr:PREDICTED: uncharacterized protein LOC108759426 [Trachymyrmex cornetzi]
MPPPKKSIKKKKETTGRRTFFKYSLHQVRNALNAIRSGTSISLASKTFDVLRTTLKRKIKNSTLETSRHMGPPPVLGSYIEEKLSTWVIETSRVGFPIEKICLLYSVKQLVDAENLLTPFKNNLPGREWFESFMRRHPHLSQKKAEYLSKVRATITENSIRNWFADTETLVGINIQVLQHPRRIFNMDETSFFRPKGGIILAKKGKASYDVFSASDKEAITTLFVINAEGEIAPPLTLYKYVRLTKNCIEAVPPGWGLGKIENGWMDSASFYGYIANIFHPYLLEQKIPLPVIVFLDGHVSHLSP